MTDSDGGTSLSLLERARSQDKEAWRRLVLLYGPLVFAWVRRVGISDNYAADVVQEVWRSVAIGIESFQRDENSGTFRGWLWTITRNKVNDFFRRERNNVEATGGTVAYEMLETYSEKESDEYIETDSHQLLHRALDLIRPEFAENTWKAFWSLTVDGRSAADVAQDLLMAPNAIHQAKFRVLKRLRQEMSGLVEGPNE